MKYIIYECDGCGETWQLTPKQNQSIRHVLTTVSIGDEKIELCDDCKVDAKLALTSWKDELTKVEVREEVEITV